MTPAQFTQARHSLKLTQTGLALKLGLSRSTIARYESGFTPIPGPVQLIINMGIKGPRPTKEIEMFTAEDKQNQLTDYIKYEILAQEHYAKEEQKQADYCDGKTREIFGVLKAMFGDDVLEEINKFSEANYNQIERTVLRLKEDA